MADNQHRLIKGYRDLSLEEVTAMNGFKGLAAAVGEACIARREEIMHMPRDTVENRAEFAEALRWLDAGELQIQQGFMAVIRSIARPTTF